MPKLKLIERIKKTRESGPQHLVALDIGTEFVKALIGRVEADGVKVVGVGRQRQRLTDMQGGAVTDISGVVENCDQALKVAEKMSGVVAKQVVIGIAGELVKGTSTTIKYKRYDPESQIDMGELRTILDKIQAKALERAKAQLARETGYDEVDVRMVNIAVTDVEIDGYRVTNPIGFQGRDVAIQLFCAFAPLVHIGALETVARDLDLDLVNIAAEPFAVAKSVGGNENTEFSAIFIDIGGGTTDIALVNNGGVEGTRMFAIGGRSFTKRLANSMNKSFGEAEQLKLDYADGKLSKTEAEKVKQALAPDVEVWLSGVQLSLSEFDHIDHLPNKILLCGGGTGLPDIVDALKGKDWHKSLGFTRQPEVKHLRPEEVNRVSDDTGQLTSYADITPMGLANLGLDVVTTETVTETLMNKLSKTLSA